MNKREANHWLVTIRKAWDEDEVRTIDTFVERPCTPIIPHLQEGLKSWNPLRFERSFQAALILGLRAHALAYDDVAATMSALLCPFLGYWRDPIRQHALEYFWQVPYPPALNGLMEIALYSNALAAHALDAAARCGAPDTVQRMLDLLAIDPEREQLVGVALANIDSSEAAEALFRLWPALTNLSRQLAACSLRHHTNAKAQRFYQSLMQEEDLSIPELSGREPTVGRRPIHFVSGKEPTKRTPQN